jgi:ParB family chromosome partitioning protein
MARNALGKGLGALIGGAPAAASAAVPVAAGDRITSVPLDSIVPSPFQPRRVFEPGQLEELAASIRESGVLQPLMVRLVGGKHELIAGERRWRASRQAGLAEVPVIIRPAGDLEAMELALVENLQRADLNPVEEAEGYARLMETFQLTQEQVAQKVGKSRAAVANALRLRGLAPESRALLGAGKISAGHAKALLGLGSAAQQESAARLVVRDDLSVRATEKLVASLLNPRPAKAKKGKAGSADWRDLEQRLQRSLGTKVKLVGTASKGHIEVEYFTEADLDRLLGQLGVRLD